MAEDFDFFVIGAGSGGVRAARIAAAHGARVAVAEEYRVGGTCVIRGCVPKKLLVYGSQFAGEFAAAAGFGWDLGEPRVDWPRLRGAVQGEVKRLEGLYRELLERHGVTIFPARATIAGPGRVALADGQEVGARHILVATGARPAVPDIPGREFAITSNEVFHLPRLPTRVVIAGAGYIANEFAGIFNGLGVKVTLVTRGERMLRGYDDELVDRLVAISRAKGIDIRFHFPFRAISQATDGTLIVDDGEAEPIETELVLFATGRVPNSAGLGLAELGVSLRPDGAIPVDEFGATNVPGIYAVGDVTGRIQLTPVAIREGQMLADHLFGGGAAPIDYTHIPTAVFAQPPLAGVGLTETGARAAGHHVRIFRSDFRPMKTVFAPTSERGLYKLVVDAETDRVLGAHMLGPEAPEILQAVAIAVCAGLTKRDFDATIALHPSMAEELVLMK